ncbi:MAG: YbjN domain-containing protein [Gemmataceae bacterium]|nr:YbjN domain-containing protein [Gemmataceae bacterium]
MKRAIAVLALLVLPSFAFAQGVSVEAFEKILTNGLKIEFDKKGDAEKVIEYDLKGTPYYAYYNAGGKFVNFLVRDKANGVTLQKVNEWNVNALWSRAYILQQAVVLETTISLDASPSVIGSYYRLFDADAKKFAEFLGK